MVMVLLLMLANRYSAVISVSGEHTHRERDREIERTSATAAERKKARI